MPRTAVWLLYARVHRLRDRFPGRQSTPFGGGDPRGPRRKSVPVHRLPGHRPGGTAGRRRSLWRGVMSGPGGHAAARFVGQSIQRREDIRLVTGRGSYVDDVTFPGQLHAHFVRSPIARGTLSAVDTSRAAESPGTIAVFTAADLNDENHAF